MLDFFGRLAETERLRYCNQFFLNVAGRFTSKRLLNSPMVRLTIYVDQGRLSVTLIEARGRKKWLSINKNMPNGAQALASYWQQ